jgi:hypothetical protein
VHGARQTGHRWGSRVGAPCRIARGKCLDTAMGLIRCSAAPEPEGPLDQENGAGIDRVGSLRWAGEPARGAAGLERLASPALPSLVPGVTRKAYRFVKPLSRAAHPTWADLTSLASRVGRPSGHRG